jgi:hypothetical protein
MVSQRTYVLIQAGILLRHGFVPDDVTGRETHDDINMVRSFGRLVDVVAQRVRFREKYLGQMFFLQNVSSAFLPPIREDHLRRRAQI